MAIITPVPKPAAAASAAALPVATDPVGDEIVWSGARCFVLFENKHTAAITVQRAVVKSQAWAPGVGPVVTPGGSVSIPANGLRLFWLDPLEVDAFINANGYIGFTYTGHNPALLISAFRF
ncbi:MAG: hypothetical protein ACRCWF_17695 [Beijerinckiaceae bacterium]